jgi:hypothetical protein
VCRKQWRNISCPPSQVAFPIILVLSRCLHFSPLAHTPHTSHLTPHTSHLTPHTSHLTPHIRNVKRQRRQPILCHDQHVPGKGAVRWQRVHACAVTRDVSHAAPLPPVAAAGPHGLRRSAHRRLQVRVRAAVQRPGCLGRRRDGQVSFAGVQCVQERRQDEAAHRVARVQEESARVNSTSAWSEVEPRPRARQS